ncbi:hypothetical protein PR202_ga30874 [Eleusine coracana subsp. coracana]|uniref:At1g61320/AtMIF1 LRR domain-containing protein n=1 Tax=Eleusine coracana subsp. coracana TaxID=191504 RepID=A0AAV5DPZ6_ELECO|nr:hypothetical protein PR202_ga30874 [Eleusine coracana subsp. coracana]
MGSRRDGSIEGRKDSPFQRDNDGDSQHGETLGCSIPYLPEVSQRQMEHESVFGGSAHLRQLPERRHDCLKSLEIKGFSSAKGLVELTCCIVKNACSLERLVLDTVPFRTRCF